MGLKSDLEFEAVFCNNVFRYEELRKAFDALIGEEEN